MLILLVTYYLNLAPTGRRIYQPYSYCTQGLSKCYQPNKDTHQNSIPKTNRSYYPFSNYNIFTQHLYSFNQNLTTYLHLLLLSGALTKSQFPVFTIYAQKSCLAIRPCARAWCFDRVQGYKLNGLIKRTATVSSRRDCLELCLGETEFTCR